MTSRVDAVTRQVLRNPPTWLRRLGTPPADPRRRPTWVAAVELIAAYRDRYLVPEHGHPLGEPEPTDPNRRIARSRALAASRRARSAATSRPITTHAAASADRNWPSL
jgi:hypothetical protein